MTKKKFKSYLKASLKPRINSGLNNEAPVGVEIVDAEFQVLGVYEKKSGTWVPMLIEAGEKNIAKMFNAEDLIALENHPCVKAGDDKLLIDDEGFTVTWIGREIAFSKRL